MKRSRLPKELAKNASKLHKHIGELLQSIGVFENFEIRQEYSVKKVNPEFTSGREKFDWVILGAEIVIECHGEHHYQPVQFGGISKEEAKRKLVEQRERDENKRRAAVEAGWTYVVVSYKEADINKSELSDKIKEAMASVVLKRAMKTLWPEVENLAKKEAVRRKIKQKIPRRPFPKKQRGFRKRKRDSPAILEQSAEEDGFKPNSCRYCAGSKFC